MGPFGVGGMPPPPVNAPQGVSPAAGVQPGQSNAVVIANKVIVFGPNDGLFVYSGTPKLGNPPIFWATSATRDPYGNTVTPTVGIAGTGEFHAPNTIINAAGTFTYAGTPAAGKLILSDANTSGTDDFGNEYLSGLSAYEQVGLGGHWQATQFIGAGRIGWATPGASQTGWVEQVTEQFIGGWTVDLSGVGPGLDGVTFRLTTGLSAFVGGSFETWHAMSPLSAGFSAGGTAPEYKMYPDGTVGLRGAVNLTATEPAGTTFFTLPAGYAPTATMQFVTQASLSGNTLGQSTVQVLSTGAVRTGASGGSGGFISMDGIRFPTD